MQEPCATFPPSEDFAKNNISVIPPLLMELRCSSNAKKCNRTAFSSLTTRTSAEGQKTASISLTKRPTTPEFETREPIQFRTPSARRCDSRDIYTHRIDGALQKPHRHYYHSLYTLSATDSEPQELGLRCLCNDRCFCATMGHGGLFDLNDPKNMQPRNMLSLFSTRKGDRAFAP